MLTISTNSPLFSGDMVQIALQQFPQSMQQSADNKWTHSLIPDYSEGKICGSKKNGSNSCKNPVQFLCVRLLFFSSWAEKLTLPQFYYCTVNLRLCLLCLLCSTSDVERHPAIIWEVLPHNAARVVTQRFQGTCLLCCEWQTDNML